MWVQKGAMYNRGVQQSIVEMHYELLSGNFTNNNSRNLINLMKDMIT